MRKLLITVAILAALGIVLLLLFDPTFGERLSLWGAEISNIRELASPPADLLDAKARWTANPMLHYRLTIRHSLLTYPHVDCLQDVEVLSETVVTPLEDTCSDDGIFSTLRL